MSGEPPSQRSPAVPHPPAMWRPGRAALAVGLFALAVRLLLLAATLLATPATAADVADLHDGREYGLYAAALGSPAALEALPSAARRLGPGYPLLVRAASSLLPPSWAALAVAVLGAALAAALLSALGVPPRAAALFAVLTPSWVAFSATAMSEGPFLALALLALLAWRRGHGAAAGLVLGAATLVRPVGAVLFAALWWCRPGRRPQRWQWATVAAFLVPPAAWAAWSLLAWGKPAAQVATYLRRDAAVPLSSFLPALADPLADPLKLAQNGVVLTLVLAAGAVLWRRWRRGGDGAARQWFWWLAAQAGFYVLLPSAWVFECLPRFLVTALPAVAAALAPWVPRRGPALVLLLALLTAVSVGIGLLWNLRALGVG